MSKAILVIDMPESCDKCPLLLRHDEERCCIPEKRNSFTTKPDWCPLKPAPEEDQVWYRYEWSDGYKKGWNDCVNYLVSE